LCMLSRRLTLQQKVKNSLKIMVPLQVLANSEQEIKYARHCPPLPTRLDMQVYTLLEKLGTHFFNDDL
jgi:hypothetical protein